MKETQRLADQYTRLFEGDSWIDVNITDTLSSISAKQAAVKPFPNVNSIWQIVNHLVSWRERVLERMQGKRAPSPDNNFFEPVTDVSDKAWKRTLKRFEASQQAWITAMGNADDRWLDKMWLPGNQSRYELVMGILQHDAYHLGQIVILKKFV